MRVIVCGGRGYKNYVKMRQVLNELHITVLINGQSWGADALSSLWAHDTGTPVAEVPALWDAFGKSAGHMRNRVMVTNFGKIDRVIAFPGGAGTRSMIRIAESLDIPVKVVE